ncbi:MAG: adenylate kinase [Candidatus Nitrosocaldaceae archaeon]
MVESKRAITVGIPGVGKSTVINRAAKMLNDIGISASVAVFGTIMLEEAKELGITNRDELRKMPIQEQKRLQEQAAMKIAAMKDDVVMIDTHLFISTKKGYYPGLPISLLNILKPTNFIMIAAEPEEILRRRLQDKTRERDICKPEEIKHDLEIAQIMVASCSILTGTPFITIFNNDGAIDKASSQIVELFSDER